MRDLGESSLTFKAPALKFGVPIIVPRRGLAHVLKLLKKKKQKRIILFERYLNKNWSQKDKLWRQILNGKKSKLQRY